jgi:hypothetical protein
MKRALIGLAALPLFASAAAAADRLSDAELDGVTAGLVVITCFNCGSSGQVSSSTSNSTGDTTTSSSSTVTWGGDSSSSGGSNGGGGGVPTGGGGVPTGGGVPSNNRTIAFGGTTTVRLPPNLGMGIN